MELLVVISIIGFLSSVVLASLNSARVKARDTVRGSDMNQIVNALALYYDDHGKFPCHSYQNSAESDYLQPLILGGYLTKQPHDPTEDPDVGKYYDYWSFKTAPMGACGAIAHLGVKLESASTNCPSYGTRTDDPQHCHIFLFEGLNCTDPYLFNDSGPIELTCQPLEDGYVSPGVWDDYEDEY